MSTKKCTIFLVILSGFFRCNIANAQLWSYIGVTDAKIKAFDKYLKKEAYQVIPHHTSDEFKAPYDEMIYRLQSLDSTLYYVHIMEVPFADKTLTITTSTDSLKIKDCMGPARLHLLRKDLFEIVYSPRGGSDDGYDNVMLLAIRNGKFIISMNLETMHDYDGPGFFGLDETHLILTGENTKKYQLTLNSHSLKRYDNKAKDFDHYYTYSLKYDNKLNIFYSLYSFMSCDVYFEDDSDKKTYITGTFPIIKLNEEEYCYMNEHWFDVYKDPKTRKVSLTLTN